MMIRFKRSAVRMILICMIVLLLQVPYVRGSDAASLRVQAADSVVRHAFRAVLEAEEAGANVSGLVATLNEAGSLLAEAEIVCRNGNLGNATNSAESASVKAESVIAEASSLKSSSQTVERNAFLSSFVLSVSGACAFLVVLFLVWARFKRLRSKRLYRLRPTVGSDADA